MTVKLLYFANLREALGMASEEIALPADVADLAALRNHLATRGEQWPLLVQSQSLRAAVNQIMAGPKTQVADGDEVAFFPPVTGG